MENILVLQGVSKKFGQQQALSDVNLTIKKGDIYVMKTESYLLTS